MPVTSFVSLLVDIPLTSHSLLRSLDYVNHYDDTSTRYRDCQAITLYPLSDVYNMEQTLIIEHCQSEMTVNVCVWEIVTWQPSEDNLSYQVNNCGQSCLQIESRMYSTYHLMTFEKKLLLFRRSQYMISNLSRVCWLTVVYSTKIDHYPQTSAEYGVPRNAIRTRTDHPSMVFLTSTDLDNYVDISQNWMCMGTMSSAEFYDRNLIECLVTLFRLCGHHSYYIIIIFMILKSDCSCMPA